MPRLYWWESYKDSLISELRTKKAGWIKKSKECHKLAEEIKKLQKEIFGKKIEKENEKEEEQEEEDETKDLKTWLEKTKKDFSSYINEERGNINISVYSYFGELFGKLKDFDRKEVKESLVIILREVEPDKNADEKVKERFIIIVEGLEREELLDKKNSETGTLKFKISSMTSEDEEDNRCITLDCEENIQTSGFTLEGAPSKKLRMWFNVEFEDDDLKSREERYNEVKEFLESKVGEKITINIEKSSSINLKNDIIDIYYPETFRELPM